MILTIVKPGASQSETERLEDGNYIVGRGSSARIVLPYADVSERHSLITVRNGVATVEDLKSANGTFVDGSPIGSQTRLSDSSVVQIGGTILRISAQSPDAAASAGQASMPFEQHHAAQHELAHNGHHRRKKRQRMEEAHVEGDEIVVHRHPKAHRIDGFREAGEDEKAP